MIEKKQYRNTFPKGAHTRFDFKEQIENRCEIFYDIHSVTWLVYACSETLNENYFIEGGAYACIISSDGMVIACWGEP